MELLGLSAEPVSCRVMEYGPPVQVGSGFEQRLARVPADGRSSVSGILVSRREGRHIALGLLEDDLLQVFFPWTLNFGTPPRFATSLALHGRRSPP